MKRLLLIVAALGSSVAGTATSSASRLQEAFRRTFLERLVNAGGGREWQAMASADLQPLFMRALAEMRARYLLTYYPRGVVREGWHDLKVTLKHARGDVTVRPGYFVPGTWIGPGTWIRP